MIESELVEDFIKSWAKQLKAGAQEAAAEERGYGSLSDDELQEMVEEEEQEFIYHLKRAMIARFNSLYANDEYRKRWAWRDAFEEVIHYAYNHKNENECNCPE